MIRKPCLINRGSDDWTRLSKGWYDEVKDYNFDQNGRLVEHSNISIICSVCYSSGGRLTGHYKTFAWAETYQLGCGVIRSKVG